MKKIAGLFFLLSLSVNLLAQTGVHQQSSTYEAPTDPLVVAKLDNWRDQKFGMIIHWGIYAVPGIVESWSICSEDWIGRDSTIKYDDYKQWYFDQSKKFNPTKFNPDQWAKAAKSAGMKYLVFTTKHHDGFAMFDTKQSDYSIAKGPFANNPKADVAKHVFESFRNQGMMIGAYFSKPDWHTENYWWPMYATADRNNNYDIRKFPWRWEAFKKYTHSQIDELMSNYGKVDILWLDGGWVRPLETVNDEVRSWGATIPAWNQDIDMATIARNSRVKQPGLLVVDRTVHGPYENYQTPEQRIPENKLDHPWESCITLGGAWGYVPNENFKSAKSVIHQLVEIVAKGGSLLLGVGPTAEGLLQEDAISRLNEIGAWMDNNGKAIYGTRTADHYKENNLFFTQAKDHSATYAISLIKDGGIPERISWNTNLPGRNGITELQTGKKLKYKIIGNNVIVELPAKLREELGNTPAIALAF
jgi:alpha-L-fucosidase